MGHKTSGAVVQAQTRAAKTRLGIVVRIGRLFRHYLIQHYLKH